MTDNTPTLGGDRIKRGENSDLKHIKGRTKSKTGDDNASGFGAVTIDFNPGPDSRDRLRRLFTLLLEHAARDGQSASGEDYPADATANGGAEEDA